MYFASQIRIHFLVTIPLSAIFLICGAFLENELLHHTFISASLALPFMLLTWLARRTYYSNHQPAGAFVCSLLYAVVLMSGLGIVLRSGQITVSIIYLVMSIAGIASGFALLWWEIQSRKIDTPVKISIPDVIGVHWDLGKWIVFASVFFLATEQIPIIFIAKLLGLDEAGAFKAVQNVVLPIIQVQAALSLIGLPVLAREFGMKNISNFRRMVFLLAAVMTSLALVYEIVIWLAQGKIEQFAYRGQYALYSHLIALYGLVPIFLGLFTSVFISIRAIQKTKIYLINGITSFVIGIPISYFSIIFYGLTGGILALSITYFAIFILNLYLYFLWCPRLA